MKERSFNKLQIVSEKRKQINVKKSNHIPTLKIHTAIIRAICQAVGYLSTLLGGPKGMPVPCDAGWPCLSALPCPAVLPSGSQQSKFHGKLLFCERCTKCSVLLGADRKRKKRKKENFVTQSEITLTNENVTMMIIYFGLCQLPSVAPQLLNIPLRWNSRFHLSSPICSMCVVHMAAVVCLLPAEAQLKVSNVLAIVLDSSRCRKRKPECPYRADIILGKTWFKRLPRNQIYTLIECVIWQ